MTSVEVTGALTEKSPAMVLISFLASVLYHALDWDKAMLNWVPFYCVKLEHKAAEMIIMLPFNNAPFLIPLSGNLNMESKGRQGPTHVNSMLAVLSSSLSRFCRK